MQDQITAIVPTPRCAISIRLATAGDLPFLDGLQKQHAHMVGWFPGKQMEGYVAMNAVLIAEESDEATERRSDEGFGTEEDARDRSRPVSSGSGPFVAPSLRRSAASPLGYVIFRDSYNGRDDVGMIYQLNVEPHRQRHLVGASLVKAAFEKASYGVRLFSCWCAQDIHANWFWEAIGFVPLAFRTGSRGRQRTHIFWQRRIREGDTTTPWWFPSQTKGGAVREDRIVFPIPPGLHWRDPMPVLLPRASDEATKRRSDEGTDPEAGAIAGSASGSGPSVAPSLRRSVASVARKIAIVRSSSKALQGLPAGKAAVITGGGIRYIDRADYVPEPEPAPVKMPRKPRAPAAKHDPKHLAAARELRDRYLEEINSDPRARSCRKANTKSPANCRTLPPSASRSCRRRSSSFPARRSASGAVCIKRLTARPTLRSPRSRRCRGASRFPAIGRYRSASAKV